MPGGLRTSTILGNADTALERTVPPAHTGVNNPAAAPSSTNVPPKAGAPEGCNFTCAAISPDGRIVGTGGRDSRVVLWESQTGREIAAMQGHTSSVLAIAFSPDGQTLASSGSDRQVILWNVKSATKRASLAGHGSQPRCLLFSPNGRVLAVADGHTAANGYTAVKLWDVASAKCSAEISLRRYVSTQEQSTINSFAFSPDGTALALAGGKLGSLDGILSLWDVQTGQIKARDGEVGHTMLPSDLCFSQDGKTLACVNGAEIELRDPETLLLKRVLHEGGFYAHIGLAPDGKVLASSHGSDPANPNGILRFWDVEKGKLRATQAEHSEAITAFAFSRDGRTLATASDDATVRLWDAVTGQPRTVLTGHSKPISSVAFSADGRALMALGKDDRVTVWTTETDDLLGEFRGNPGSDAINWSPDGSKLAIWSSKSIMVFDIRTRRLMHAAEKGLDVRLSDFAFFNGSKEIRYCSRPESALVDVTSWGRVVDLLTGGMQASFSGRKVEFSPDSTLVAVTRPDSDLEILDVATGRRLGLLSPDEDEKRNWHCDWWTTFSPDGRTMLAFWSGHTRGGVALYEITPQRRERCFQVADVGSSCLFACRTPARNEDVLGHRYHFRRSYGRDSGSAALPGR